jgi:hypothetical protein
VLYVPQVLPRPVRRRMRLGLDVEGLEGLVEDPARVHGEDRRDLDELLPLGLRPVDVLHFPPQAVDVRVLEALHDIRDAGLGQNHDLFGSGVQNYTAKMGKVRPRTRQEKRVLEYPVPSLA